MPPHPKYSAQHHLPPGIKETANKRKSGAIDHTWTRIPGNIGNGHSSMLPFWVLLAASRPVQVILTSYTRYHKLVRPVDENKETGVVTYTWYLPILRQRWNSAKKLWQDMRQDYLMLLTFCRHRIERQMMHVRKGWAKLKATSMHSDRLSDSMLAAIMSAATQLKSLVAEVMLAVSKGELLPAPITCPFESCVTQLWFCLQLENPIITDTTVAAMEILVASSVPSTPIPPSTPPQPGCAVADDDGDDPAASAALGALAPAAARAAALAIAAAAPAAAPAAADADADANAAANAAAADAQAAAAAARAAVQEHNRAYSAAAVQERLTLEANRAHIESQMRDEANEADAAIEDGDSFEALVAHFKGPNARMEIFRCISTGECYFRGRLLAPGEYRRAEEAAGLPPSQNTGPAGVLVAATPEAASATNEAEPEPRPKLYSYERVEAFASLMRGNMSLYRDEPRAGAVYPGNVLSGSYPEGFSADPVDGYDARESVKRRYDEAFGCYANRCDYLDENGFKDGRHGDRIVQPPQPGMSPAQLCVASAHRERLVALTRMEMKAWGALARAASDNSKLCASLLEDTHSSQADHFLEIVQTAY